MSQKYNCNFECATFYCNKYIKSELVYLLVIELFILKDSIQQLQNNLKEIIIIISFSIMNLILMIMLKHRYDYKNLMHVIVNQVTTSITFSLIIYLIIHCQQDKQMIILYAILGKLIFSQKVKIPEDGYGQKKNSVRIIFKCLQSCILGSIVFINQNLIEFSIEIVILAFEMLLNTLVFCIFIGKFKKNIEQQITILKSSRNFIISQYPVLNERINSLNCDIEFDTSFLLEILNNSDEGISLFNENQEMIYSSNSIYRILKTQNPRLIIELLMNLQNCSNDQNYQTIGNEKHQEKKDKINSVSSAVQLIYQRYQQMILKQKDDIFDYDLAQLNMELTCNQVIQNQQQIQDDPNEKLYKISLRPYLHNKQLLILIIILDITHFNKIKILKIVDENKSQMMEFVSHEFRTPLSCIILLVQSLINQSESLVIHTFLDPILTSAESLLSLIQDMLDLAQMRASKFKLFYEQFDIIQLMENLKTLLMPSLKAKQNQLIILKNENQQMFIVSDMNRIRQILINLIGNASKFTTKGTITIGFKKLSQEYIEIFVQDTGIGISPQDQRKLFKAFSKLDDSKQMNSKGVGLGLMISNIIAQRLSKKNLQNELESPGLLVESDGSDQGSRFFFRIFCKQIRRSVQILQLSSDQISCPIKSIQCENLSNIKGLNKIQTINQSIKPKIQKQKISLKPRPSFEFKIKETQEKQFSCSCFDTLIVDDEPINIIALKQFLKNMNLKIDSTTNPIEAIQKVKNYKCHHKMKVNYKIIFMDIEMPQIDGIQTSIEILKLYPEMLIVGITGHSGEKIQEQIRKAGMKFLLTKPPNINQIKEILNDLETS